MIRTINYTIQEVDIGKTINEYLRSRYYSAKILTFFRHTEGSILLNGKAVFMKTKMSAGDVLTVVYEEEDESENIEPANLTFTIVYEDEDIMVIDKPADMPVHPSINNYTNTLANGIAYYFMSRNQQFVFRCINRLDRNTSGLLIVAKHRLAAGILSDFMVNRMIQRKYLAVVCGVFQEKSGTIDLPIGRVGESVIERFVDFENGDRAITHYQVLEEYDDSSLLQVKLDTGRTHQIRVHMSYIGHPLVGDGMYNPNPGELKRQALHSHSLEFLHPITLEKMSFISDMPEDIMQVCKKKVYLVQL